jgi:hypothetical protein
VFPITALAELAKAFPPAVMTEAVLRLCTMTAITATPMSAVTIDTSCSPAFMSLSFYESANEIDNLRPVRADKTSNHDEDSDSLR